MNRRGFTLVECLVAAGIFLLAAASFSAIMRNAKYQLSLLPARTKAVMAARSQMENLSGQAASAELEVIRVEVNWLPPHRPIVLYSLRSGY